MDARSRRGRRHRRRRDGQASPRPSRRSRGRRGGAARRARRAQARVAGAGRRGGRGGGSLALAAGITLYVSSMRPGHRWGEGSRRERRDPQRRHARPRRPRRPRLRRGPPRASRSTRSTRPRVASRSSRSPWWERYRRGEGGRAVERGHHDRGRSGGEVTRRMAMAALIAVGLSLGGLGLGGAALAASTHGRQPGGERHPGDVERRRASIDSRLQDLATQLTTRAALRPLQRLHPGLPHPVPAPAPGRQDHHLCPAHGSGPACLARRHRRGERREALQAHLPDRLSGRRGRPLNVQVTASASTPFFVGVQSNKTSATFVELKVYP